MISTTNYLNWWVFRISGCLNTEAVRARLPTEKERFRAFSGVEGWCGKAGEMENHKKNKNIGCWGSKSGKLYHLNFHFFGGNWLHSSHSMFMFLVGVSTVDVFPQIFFLESGFMMYFSMIVPDGERWLEDMCVSKNRGTPKWMVYNGKPYY